MSADLPPLGAAEIGPLAGGADVLWAFVFDLSRRLEPTSWRLVGGLMVVAHGVVASRTPPRVTRDVDVLAPDHAPPTRSLLTRRLGETIAIDGGRQAPARGGIITLNSRDYGRADIPVPDLLGALVLKAAAWRVDSRDRERHSGDAAFLTSLIQDPLAEVSRFRGSDRKRLRALDRGALGSSDAAEWRALGDHGVDGYLAWKVLVGN